MERIRSFCDSIEEFSKFFIGWLENENSVNNEETKKYSKIATALVRISLNAVGLYSGKIPPFAGLEVINESRDYLEKVGLEISRRILHAAIIIDKTNLHGYIYLVKTVNHFPHLWKSDIDIWLRELLNSTTKTENFLKRITGEDFNLWETRPEIILNRYFYFREKIFWWALDMIDSYNLGSNVEESINKMRYAPPLVTVDIPYATENEELINNLYLEKLRIPAFGKTEVLPNIKFSKLS